MLWCSPEVRWNLVLGMHSFLFVIAWLPHLEGDDWYLVLAGEDLDNLHV